jgi:EmrB/QacA subfamily drug resistance transporter
VKAIDLEARAVMDGRPRLIFAIVSIALLMSSIDQTIVATALPALQRDLHARIDWAAWTITIYSLARVLVLPLAGKLSDQYGRRTIFLTSVGIFTASSLCCGLAGNIYLLVALRAMQAVGGAAFMPSATGLVADHFGHRRGRAVGLFTSITPIGGIIGPVLGGLFVTYWSWRGIFLVNVPIGVVLMLLAARFIPGGVAGGHRPPFDVVGGCLLGAGVLAAMLGISLVGEGSAPIWTAQFVLPEVFAFLSVAAFVRHVGRSDHPFIEPRLLHGRDFAALNLINLLYGSAVLGFGALVPLYAVERFGLSPLASGTLLNARAIAMLVVSGLASLLLSRTGYRRPLVFGFFTTAVGLLVMSSTPFGVTPYVWLAVATGVSGIGMGSTGPASMNASLQLATADIAAIASLRQMFRQVGSITSISVATAILSRSDQPGLVLAHVFAVFAGLLVCALPLVLLVPDHRGDW